MKRLIAITAATLCVFAVTATAKTSVPTRVSIHENPTFHGLVWNPGDATRAEKRACRRGRLVSVYKDKPSLDQLQGRTHTARTGRWEKAVDAHHGDYYAVVRRKVTSTGVVCQRARSFNIAVH